MPEVDVVESLDDLGRRQVPLEELARGGRLVVQFRDVPVALRIVVVGVDDDLPGQRLDRHIPVSSQGNADDHEVGRLGRLPRRSGPGVGTQLLDQSRQRLGPP